METKKNKPLINDIMDNPEKYARTLRELVTRNQENRLAKQVDSVVAKYFPISMNAATQDDETEKLSNPFNTKRYIDQILDNLYDEEDEILSERNRLEEMINYGKEEE